MGNHYASIRQYYHASLVETKQSCGLSWPTGMPGNKTALTGGWFRQHNLEDDACLWGFRRGGSDKESAASEDFLGIKTRQTQGHADA
jgi:hypothetical protein